MGCTDGTEGDKNGGVGGDCIVEESTNNILNRVDSLWQKSGGVVEIFCELDFGAIGGLRLGVGGILSTFGVGMLELLQCFVNIAWHREVYSPVDVVPHKGEAAEKRSGPVNGDGVQAAECGDEIVHRGVAGVINTEIVDDMK